MTSLQEKYTRLLSLTEKIIRLHKLKSHRKYLTYDEKRDLQNAEAMADRMIRENESKKVITKELF